MTPSNYNFHYAVSGAVIKYIQDSIGLSGQNSESMSFGVRPVIALKNSMVTYIGDGSKDNPYLIRYPLISDVIVNNDDNKGSINISQVEDIGEASKVLFTIQSKKGINYLL